MNTENNEIMIKVASMVLVSVLALIFPLPVFAGSQAANHAVTVSVPTVLSFEADTSDFTLTFADYVAGSETDTKIVTYTIKANNMTRTSGVVSAKLDSLFTGMDFKADPGVYTKVGGNASLAESFSGFSTIDTTGVNLMDRVTDSGTGKTARGSFSNTWKGVATGELEPSSPPRTLTVTLVDV